MVHPINTHHFKNRAIFSYRTRLFQNRTALWVGLNPAYRVVSGPTPQILIISKIARFSVTEHDFLQNRTTLWFSLTNTHHFKIRPIFSYRTRILAKSYDFVGWSEPGLI